MNSYLTTPGCTRQLLGLERRAARGGRDTIDNAPGAFDDLANAAAGALVAAIGPSEPALLTYYRQLAAEPGVTTTGVDTVAPDGGRDTSPTRPPSI